MGHRRWVTPPSRFSQPDANTPPIPDDLNDTRLDDSRVLTKAEQELHQLMKQLEPHLSARDTGGGSNKTTRPRLALTDGKGQAEEVEGDGKPAQQATTSTITADEFYMRLKAKYYTARVYRYRLSHLQGEAESTLLAEMRAKVGPIVEELLGWTRKDRSNDPMVAITGLCVYAYNRLERRLSQRFGSYSRRFSNIW